MKKKEKRNLLILIAVAIVIIAIIFFVTRGGKNNTPAQNTTGNEVVEEFVQVLEDGTKLNTSTKLNQSKKLEGLEIGNIQLTNRNGISVVLADVVNNSSTATDLMPVILTLLDKNGNVLVELNGLIDPVEPGGTAQLNMGVTADYANAYDFTIVRK